MSRKRPGERDYSEIRVSRHAIERFAERFVARALASEPCEDEIQDLAALEAELRGSLKRAKRLGRNPRNDAIAVLGLYRGEMLIAILQANVCATVLRWEQFEERMAEFGRNRLPKKPKRMLARLQEREGDDGGRLDL